MQDKRIYLTTEFFYFKPLLHLREEGLDPHMVRVVGQGLKLPESNQIVNNAIEESSQVSKLKIESIDWVKKMVKNVWLPSNLSQILLAVPNIVNEDGFIAAWDIKGQIFQLIITNKRIHLLTGRIPKTSTSVPSAKEAYGFYCANMYLNLRESMKSSEWEMRDFGGLLLGYRHFQYYRYWEHSLIFLTDGQGIKLSIIKADGESSPPQRQSFIESPTPWFNV